MLLPHVGMVELNITGTNPSLNVAGAEDIIPWGGTYVFPTEDFIPTISSTSLLDTSDGTGARTVRVEGIRMNDGSFGDESFESFEQSEVVVMNGTTPVALTKTYMRINRAVVLTTGTGERNAGDIDVLEVANIVARIPALAGQSQQLVFSFPSQWSEIRLHGLHVWINDTVGLITTDIRIIDGKFAASRKVGRILTTRGLLHSFMDNPVGIPMFPGGDLIVSATTTTEGIIHTGSMYITARRRRRPDTGVGFVPE